MTSLKVWERRSGNPNNGGLLFRFPARIAAQIQFDPQSDAAETPPPSSEKAKPEIANGSPVATPSGLPGLRGSGARPRI